MKSCGNNTFELLTIIVNEGWGSKILHAAKKHGVCGGTIMLGRGTVRSGVMRFLGLVDEQKEIVLIVSGRHAAFNLIESLDKEYNFRKPNHGIAFCIPVGRIFGSKYCKACTDDMIGGEDTIMYNAIYVIVDKGNAEDVIDAAARAGSTGGTIMNARGSGIHETSRILTMEIEPEKEVVLIISEVGRTESIASTIIDALGIEKPGNGIMFIQDVSKVYGLRDVK